MSDLNLNCHLESADSVRTGLKNPTRHQHFYKFFAEAFTHILLGEEIRLGQTPMYDSRGVVSFMGEMLDAREQFIKERKDVVIERFSPLVLTHYETIKNKKGSSYRFQRKEDVLRDTFLIKLEDGLRISSIPGIAENPNEIIKFVQENRFAIKHMRGNLLDRLDKEELEHLEHLEKIDSYFKRYPDTVVPNKDFAFMPLKEGVRNVVDNRPAKCLPETNLILGVYSQTLNCKSGYGRSELYAYLESSLRGMDKLHLIEPAKEVVDSLYMYNEARIAGAISETSSSGYFSNDHHLMCISDELNNIVDLTKVNIDRVTNQIPMRPVLQLVDFNGTALSDYSYRKRLLLGLASFTATDDFHPMRQHALSVQARFHGSLIDYWSERFQKAENHESLKGLISLDLATTGAFSIKFSTDNKNPHVFGAIVPGAVATHESSCMLTDHLIKQTIGDAGKQFGSMIPVAR